MSVVRVSVKPEIIRWAMGYIPENEIDDKFSNNIKKWLDGECEPTFGQVEEFSRKSHVPFEYFLLDSPPCENLELLKYRTVNSQKLSNPSRNLIDTVYGMEDVRDWMKDYRKDYGFGTVSVVGCVSGEQGAYPTACRIRDDLGLTDAWFEGSRNPRDSFSRVRERLQEYGIVVMVNGIVGSNTRRSLDTEEFRAFAMVDERAPLIFINGTDSDGGRLFSLLHEAAHIWIGVDDFYNDSTFGETCDKELERICNAVAAEILVPESIFTERWRRTGGEAVDRIAALAKYFRCGQTVVARRALDHYEISRKDYDEVVRGSMEGYRRIKEKGVSGGDYYKNQAYRLDRRFLIALCDSVRDGRTSYAEAYRLTNTSPKSFGEIEKNLDRSYGYAARDVSD